jgi:hypothetical protein
MAAGQDEPTALSASVEHPLEVGQQGRETLHLIQDAAVFHLPEETSRVSFSRCPCARVFQGKVLLARKCHPGQRSLSRLAGTQDCHSRILGGGLDQLLCDVSSDHRVMALRSPVIHKLQVRFA